MKLLIIYYLSNVYKYVCITYSYLSKKNINKQLNKIWVN